MTTKQQQQKQQPRLVFHTKEIYGREKEIHQLVSVLERVTKIPFSSTTTTNTTSSSSSLPQTIFLSGYSGSGKTRLIEESILQFQKEHVVDVTTTTTTTTTTIKDQPKPQQILYLKGKYGELNKPAPYQGIVDSIENYIKTLSNQERRHMIQHVQEYVIGNGR